jgi:hypothetical protein
MHHNALSWLGCSTEARKSVAKPSTANPIRLRANLTVGAADAEADLAFLKHCYVDTGDLAVLKDTANPKCVLLGRTGTGKSALAKMVLDTEQYSIELSPEVLSLNYISNSNVISLFEESGVKLDVFYKLLWQHVITVELLKKKYRLYNEDNQRSFMATLSGLLRRDRAKERALSYLKEWGDHFWQETEHRVKEFTKKLESELAGSLSLSTSPLELGAEGAQRLSEEQKVESCDDRRR